jgi:uncharacterized membrane protein
VNSLFYIKLFLATFIIFLAVDFVWLSFVATSYYKEQIGFLLSTQPNILAAGVFYTVYVIGLLYFVVLPALKVKKSHAGIVGFAGAFFGFVAYGTYELTNFATVANWPFELVMVDLIWGTVLTAVTAWASFMVGRKLL